MKEGKMLARFKKQCMVTMLAAAMLLGSVGGAKAIEFNAAGEWLVGFGVGDHHLLNKAGGNKYSNDDKFGAAQRVKLQLDAVASESLSGTVFFEIGTQNWGSAGDGAALGADGLQVKVKNAYIDWAVPNSDLKFRMGLQGVAMPNVAGGSSILDGDAAAVVANYQFNDNVGLTAFWARPVNDNFDGSGSIDSRSNKSGWLDNMDLFALTLPLTFDGVEATPWVMYGLMGKNALRQSADGWGTNDGALDYTIPGATPGMNFVSGQPGGDPSTKKAWGNMFWAGLPVALTLWDPLNIEFDLNYGYVEEMGRYDVYKRGSEIKRASTEREGWLIKALVEYKMDWGVPGIFAWYGSGDDGDVSNGSERMPSIAGAANFTPFIGDGNLAWGPGSNPCDWSMSYAGSWGIGLQVRDMSFMEDLSHTFIASYRGGTNSPSMVKYMADPYAGMEGFGADGPYLTTNDGLMEFNLISNYKMYENFDINVELGYVVNMIDSDTWDKSYLNNSGYKKQDAWKAQVVFAYSF